MNAGAHTSARIRVKCPVIENKTFVSGNAAEAMDQLGVRSPKWQEGTYEYFPSQNEPVEYMDDLYYNVKIVNGADSVDSDECYKQGIYHMELSRQR